MKFRSSGNTHRPKGKGKYGKAASVTTSHEIVAAGFGSGNECVADITVTL
jgi:hypothetical protein